MFANILRILSEEAEVNIVYPHPDEVSLSKKQNQKCSEHGRNIQCMGEPTQQSTKWYCAILTCWLLLRACSYRKQPFTKYSFFKLSLEQPYIVPLHSELLPKAGVVVGYSFWKTPFVWIRRLRNSKGCINVYPLNDIFWRS